MAFDRTNPADLLALKTEVNTDPLGLGYDAASGSTSKVLERLNESAFNTGGEMGVAPMTTRSLLNILLGEAVSSQDQFKVTLMFQACDGLSDNLSEFREATKLLSASISTGIDLIMRPLNRAEVLFANDDQYGTKEFVTISRSDWVAARDS